MQIHAGPASRRGRRGPLARLSGPEATCNSRPAARGRQRAAAPRMPAPERPRSRRPQSQPGPGELCVRPRKIVFADELRPREPLHPEKHPRDLGPRLNPVPDYELLSTWAGSERPQASAGSRDDKGSHGWGNRARGLQGRG
uniref:Occludin/ELL domain containing 1 n=1 Tax=Mus musculus TaxID=10090 RepID=D3Z3P1_MOUSE